MNDIIQKIEETYAPLLTEASLAREQAVLNENTLIAQKAEEIKNVTAYYQALDDLARAQTIIDNAPPQVVQANKLIK